MSISRFTFLAIAVAISAACALGLVVATATDANAQQRNFKLVDTPFEFAKVFEGPDTILETDISTFRSVIDEDDDVAVAGVFRLIRKNAAVGEKAVFVTVTLAVCGYPGVVVLHSKDFTLDGLPAGETVDSQPIAARPNTVAAAAYETLCAANVKPRPPERGYKAPERYTKFWA